MFCTRLKEFLSERGVDYVDRDVSGDEQALQELTLLGFMTTPVTQIGDEVVVGFDRKRLEALLG